MSGEGIRVCVPFLLPASSLIRLEDSRAAKMHSRALFTVGKSLPLRSASGRLGQHASWTRAMSVTTQEATGSTTVDQAPPPAVSSQSGEAKSSQVRRRKRLPKRAPISNASPRQWCRPLAPGVLPAYDFAVELLKADSIKIKSEAELLSTQIQAAEDKRMEEIAKQGEGVPQTVNQLDDELEALRKRLRILEVQSEVNLLDVRWRVANAMRMCSIRLFMEL